MKFLIQVKKQETELILSTENETIKKVSPGLTSLGLEIASDKTLLENLLPAIDKILKQAKIKDMPEFFVECDPDASVISCNIAKATASGLNVK
jgi:hypothetical protein